MDSKTILVVDDERDVCELFEIKFRKQIRKQELAFLYAHDGDEALKLLQEHPDTTVVLTDLNMPKMDGLTLLQHLHDEHEFNGHAIVITAYGDYERQRAAMHNGAFDFLSKPLDFSDLEATLNRALSQQEKLKKRYEELECAHIQAQAEIGRLTDELAHAHARIAELEGGIA